MLQTKRFALSVKCKVTSTLTQHSPNMKARLPLRKRKGPTAPCVSWEFARIAWKVLWAETASICSSVKEKPRNSEISFIPTTKFWGKKYLKDNHLSVGLTEGEVFLNQQRSFIYLMSENPCYAPQAASELLLFLSPLPGLSSLPLRHGWGGGPLFLHSPCSNPSSHNSQNDPPHSSAQTPSVPSGWKPESL